MSDEDLRSKFGNILESIRTSRGLKMKELAIKLGLDYRSVSLISNYENGIQSIAGATVDFIDLLLRKMELEQAEKDSLIFIRMLIIRRQISKMSPRPADLDTFIDSEFSRFKQYREGEYESLVGLHKIIKEAKESKGYYDDASIFLLALWNEMLRLDVLISLFGQRGEPPPDSLKEDFARIRKSIEVEIIILSAKSDAKSDL